jgi:hypothetical protein
MNHGVFRIARGSSASLWFCAGFGIFLFLLGTFMSTVWLFGSRIVQLEVSDRGVRVRGDIYGRLIPRGALRIDQAKPLDIGADPGHAPAGRTNGIGLPNYQAGWFRLSNGSSALLFVTDWSRAVLVPTNERFDLVVSPSDPQAFLAALNRPTTSGATFDLSPAPSRSKASILELLIGPALLLPIALAALFGYLAYSTRHVTFEISPQGLRIRGDLFGRLIPMGSLRIEEAEILDLKKVKTHRPLLRTMGVGLPGYSSGWFRLSGSGKGLLFLSDPTRAVYLPTTNGYALLVSPDDPHAFLAALEACREPASGA